MRGDVAEAKVITNPETGRAHVYAPVPPKTVEALGRNPRLRRSSAISYFAVAAGLAALENAGVNLTPDAAARTAIVFAISSGGVIYTRKFYEQIVKHGANTASPLLFPETVYNAPASHLAAQLGVDGASYTLVSDSTVGFSALEFAGQLLATSDLDHVVVVGAEESDWILCEAYRDWRFSRRPGSTQGALLAEGAAAVVLGREGDLELTPHPGDPIFRQNTAGAALRRVHAALVPEGEVDPGCGHRRRQWHARRLRGKERRALAERFPGSEISITPKLRLQARPSARARSFKPSSPRSPSATAPIPGVPGANGKPASSVLVSALGDSITRPAARWCGKRAAEG